MQAIKMRGASNGSPEEAQDSLAAVRALPGFLFGYVEAKEHRVVSFHADTHPNSPLAKGQERLDIVFGGSPSPAVLADIDEAIAGIRAMARPSSLKTSP